MYAQLHHSIGLLVSLNEKEKQILENAFTLETYKKKALLCPLGTVSQKIYFVNKGLLRLYYLNEGHEITAFLFSENLFASAFPSFIEQKPSEQILETLEDCEVLSITKDKLEQLYIDVPAFNTFTRKMAEQRFINAQRFFVSHLTQKPEVRYRHFVKQFPDLVQRVPQHIIASFLGVTAVSLSRIRNRK